MLEPYRDEIEAFGKNWCGPEKYEIWEEVLVAKFPKVRGGDGQSVDVFGCATPARFYTLKVKSEPNSMGKPQNAFEIMTGSGAWKIAAEIAAAVASGMLGFSLTEEDNEPRS